MMLLDGLDYRGFRFGSCVWGSEVDSHVGFLFSAVFGVVVAEELCGGVQGRGVFGGVKPRIEVFCEEQVFCYGKDFLDRNLLLVYSLHKIN